MGYSSSVRLGVEVTKIIGNRQLRKRIHVQGPWTSHRTCASSRGAWSMCARAAATRCCEGVCAYRPCQAFKQRVKENDLKKQQVDFQWRFSRATRLRRRARALSASASQLGLGLRTCGAEETSGSTLGIFDLRQRAWNLMTFKPNRKAESHEDG